MKQPLTNKVYWQAFLKASLFQLIFLALTTSLSFADSVTKNARLHHKKLPAAEITVSGHVKDFESSQPLPGVNVIVKGTTIGTTTDANGNYTLTVPKSDNVLIFSFIGYATKEETVGTRTD